MSILVNGVLGFLLLNSPASTRAASNSGKCRYYERAVEDVTTDASSSSKSSECKTQPHKMPIRIIDRDGDEVTFEVSQVWSDPTSCNDNGVNNIDYIITTFGDGNDGDTICNAEGPVLLCDEVRTYTALCDPNDNTVEVDVYINDDHYGGWKDVADQGTLYSDPSLCPPDGFPNFCTADKFCHFRYKLYCLPCDDEATMASSSSSSTRTDVGGSTGSSCPQSLVRRVPNFDHHRCKTDPDVDINSSMITIIEGDGDTVRFNVTQVFGCDKTYPLDRIDWLMAVYDDPTNGNVCDTQGSTNDKDETLLCNQQKEYVAQCTDGKALIDLYLNDVQYGGPVRGTKPLEVDEESCPPNGFPSGCDVNKYCHFQYLLTCEPCGAALTAPTPPPTPPPTCQVQTPAETYGTAYDERCYTSLHDRNDLVVMEDTGLPVKVVQRLGHRVIFEVHACHDNSPFSWVAVENLEDDVCITMQSSCKTERYDFGCGSDMQTQIRIFIYEPDVISSRGGSKVPTRCEGGPWMGFPNNEDKKSMCFYDFELSCDPCMKVENPPPPKKTKLSLTDRTKDIPSGAKQAPCCECPNEFEVIDLSNIDIVYEDTDDRRSLGWLESSLNADGAGQRSLTTASGDTYSSSSGSDDLDRKKSPPGLDRNKSPTGLARPGRPGTAGLSTSLTTAPPPSPRTIPRLGPRGCVDCPCLAPSCKCPDGSEGVVMRSGGRYRYNSGSYGRGSSGRPDNNASGEVKCICRHSRSNPTPPSPCPPGEKLKRRNGNNNWRSQDSDRCVPICPNGYQWQGDSSSQQSDSGQRNPTYRTVPQGCVRITNRKLRGQR